jgi:hypothetical protein
MNSRRCIAVPFETALKEFSVLLMVFIDQRVNAVNAPAIPNLGGGGGAP